jgi:predicted DNA-binding transcriptional regulator AlpA
MDYGIFLKKYQSIYEEPPMAKLLTYTQIEKIYGLKKSTLTKMYMHGQFIPCIKIGNRNYFEVAMLEQWINNRTVVIMP